MRHTFSIRKPVSLLLLLLLVPAFGCVWAQSLVNPSGSQTQSKPLEVDVQFGKGALEVPDTTVGLDALSSYKAALVISFDGTRAGQPSKWSKTYVMLASTAPAIRQVTMDATGDLSGPQHASLAEAGGATYEVKADGSCSAGASPEGDSPAARMEPAAFLSGVMGADEAGAETINGIAAGHYTFDERALGQAGFSKSTGDIWVAPNSGLVLRYVLTTQANSDYLGDGMEGTLTWHYDLTDINQPVTISLPDACPQGLIDAPLMPDAQDVRRLPGLTVYSAPGGIQDAMAFYSAQLPSLGWAPTGTPLTDEKMGLLKFEKDGKQLSVIIRPAGTMVTVRLALATAPAPMLAP